MSAKRNTLADLARRMAALYAGNTRSIGKFEPKSGRMHTDYHAPSVKDFAEHIEGGHGIGVVPVTDDGTASWAAIDIDNHDDESGEDILIAPIAEAIVLNKLPLIACRSKSGGVHVYLFLEKPLAAARVRQAMITWAALLGHPGVEVFPKQTKLAEFNGKKALGNWINLPYLGGDDTVRWAFHGGRKLTLSEFLSLAEKSLQTAAGLNQSVMTDHPQAPPCIQQMMMKGVDQGHRNEAMYNAVVYLRKMDPAGFEERAADINFTMFAKPLGKSELVRTVGSASKPDYRYRCNEEPIKSLCDRSTCLKRKHGISSEEIERMDAISALPEFSDVVKYLSEPIRWELQVDGKKISNISTAQLLDWKYMREMIADSLTRIVPMIKNQEWERILQPLIVQARMVDVPREASISGVVRARLAEFASKTDLTAGGTDMASRKSILRGMPCVVDIHGQREVAFRAQDFINYLKRTKSEELKGTNLWFAIRDSGVTHQRLRVDSKKSINVWTMPIDKLDLEPPDHPIIETKL